MFKWLLFEVVKFGRQEEEKAYRENAAKVLKKYGITEKVWQVSGRTFGQVMVEWNEFESEQEAQAKFAKVFADEEWQALQEERAKLETVVPGSGEFYILTDS